MPKNAPVPPPPVEENKFPPFAHLVAVEFQALAKSPNVLLADVDGDALFAEYLAAFPPGTNPLFKERTEHDCACCKHFIRRVGAIRLNGTDPRGSRGAA